MKAIPFSKYFIKGTIFFLIVLWVYTVGSKLLAFEEFVSAMHNQVFSEWLSGLLIYLIPASEIFVGLLLILNPNKLTGLWLSLILLSSFTIYIWLILWGFYDRVPCGCGGVLKWLSWSQHLFFNLFFLCISSVSIFFIIKERRAKA